MARYYPNKKLTVEDCHSISTTFLKRYGHFSRPFSNGTATWSFRGEELGSVSYSVYLPGKEVNFWYTQTNRDTGEARELKYKVNLVTTPCNYGGERYWFVCNGCSRRVGTLHLLGRKPFLCRQCLNLSYESRNRSKYFRKYDGLYRVIDAAKELEGLRVKFFKGRPTRQYLRLISKISDDSVFATR